MKKRKVVMVKWFESFTEGQNPNKFIIVFEDGTLYVFFKDSLMNNDKANKTVKIPVTQKEGEGQINPANVEFKEITREQIIKLM